MLTKNILICISICGICFVTIAEQIGNKNNTDIVENGDITAEGNIKKEREFVKTQIFFRAITSPGEYIFIRGGLSSNDQRVCVENNANVDPCSIPIRHTIRPQDSGSSYLKLSEGDNFLDWYGKEETQGNFSGTLQAVGTPLMWTTNINDPLGATVEIEGHGYTPYNRFGEHYWFVELEMDCSASDNGWFELKTYRMLGGWEGNVNQYDRCGGHVTTYKPYSTLNHLAFCGKMNIFFEGHPECSMYEIPNQIDPLPETCGASKMFNDESSAQQAYIVNGSPASLGRWPWQGVLQWDDTIGGCGGVLIDQRWALTAAHCVYNSWPAQMKVRTGEQNLIVDQGHEQVLQVLRIHIHDCYQSDQCGDLPYNDYDLAILELAESADLDNAITNTVCLPYGYQVDDFVGDICYATGFGDTKGTGHNYRLHQVQAPVHTHDFCVNWWGSDKITTRQLCMGTATTSACGGDSGSPLVCWRDDRWILAGVTSWGSSDCQNNPSVYSRISEYMSWIQEITGLKKCI